MKKTFTPTFIWLCLWFLMACNQPKSRVDIATNNKNAAFDSLKIAFNKIPHQNTDSTLKTFAVIREVYLKPGNKAALMEYYKLATYYLCFDLNDQGAAEIMADSALLLGDVEKHLRYKAYLIYGTFALYIQDYQKAASYLLNAKALQPIPIDSAVYLDICGALAEVYAGLQDFENASKYYEPILTDAQKNKDTLQKIKAYINAYKYVDPNISSVKEKMYLNKAKGLAEASSNKKLNPYVNYYLSNYFLDREIYDSCQFYAQQSLESMNKMAENVQHKEKIILTLADCYLAEKKYAQAREILNELDTNNTIEQLNIIDKINYFETLYAINKQDNKPEKALEAQEKLYKLRALNDKNQASELLRNYELSFKKLGKEMQLLKAKNTITKQKHWLTFVVALSVVISLLIIAIALNWRKKKQRETERLIAEQNMALKEKENTYLLQQIDDRNRIAREMHDDMGASLTSVFMAIHLIKMNPSDPSALEIISRSANSLSYQINEIIWNTNSKNDNLKSLIHYIARFAKNFLSEANIALIWNDNEVSKNPTIYGYSRRSIFLIVKELLNNAVKHALATEVSITASYINDVLHFTITDNGVGIENNLQSKNNKGNGLENIKNAVEKLKGQIIWEQKNGTTIHLSIPLKQVSL